MWETGKKTKEPHSLENSAKLKLCQFYLYKLCYHWISPLLGFLNNNKVINNDDDGNDSSGYSYDTYYVPGISSKSFSSFTPHNNHLTDEELEAQRGYGFCPPKYRSRAKIHTPAICCRVYPLSHYTSHKSFTVSEFHSHLFIHLFKKNLYYSKNYAYYKKGNIWTLRLERLSPGFMELRVQWSHADIKRAIMNVAGISFHISVYALFPL